jgi:ABC-type antimicrobial peptide transport system permease subunit
MSYSVARRTNEIGVRMALGAKSSDVLRLVMRESLKLVFIGIGIGLVGVFAAGRLVASLLYGLATTDPVTIVAAVALMILVSIVAGYLPARRASRVDPMEALRYE